MSDPIDNAALIPAEEVEACEAWQMPILEGRGNVVSAAGKKKRKQVKPKDPMAGPMTASKLESIQQQAFQEAQEKGYAAGYQAGMQQAQAEANEIKAQLNRIMGQLMHPLTEQQHELEQAIVHLSSGLAKAMVTNLPEPNAEQVLGVVRQAMAELPETSQNIRVMMHPSDAELVRQAVEDQANDWQIIADPSLVSGGCVVKTDHSYIDFTLDARFQLMVSELFKQHQGQPVPGVDGSGEP